MPAIKLQCQKCKHEPLCSADRYEKLKKKFGSEDALKKSYLCKKCRPEEPKKVKPTEVKEIKKEEKKK